MPIKPPDFRDVGNSLWLGQALEKKAEPSVRTAVGRAYYSAYLNTRDVLRTCYGDSDYDVAHGALTTYMINSGKPTLKLAGNLLKELCEAREIADYDLDDTLTHESLEQLVDNATEVIDRAPYLQTEFSSLAYHVPRRS